MAKRAPAGEVAYNPLDISLAQSVVKGAGTAHDERILSGEGSTGLAVADHAQAFQSASNGRLVELPGHNSGIASVRTHSSRSLHREKRVLVTPEEERQVERLVDRIGEQLGSSLKLSHLLRACMAVLCHAEEELLRHSAELCSLPRPANGDAVALAQFEQALAKLISRSLQDAPVIR